MVGGFDSVQRRAMEILDHFFGFLEQYAWIGSATQFVHLENTLDIHVQKVADAIGMQLCLTKVYYLYFTISPYIY